MNPNTDPSSNPARFGITEPDFSGLDSAGDIVRDAAKFGLLDDLRKLLCHGCPESGDERAATAVRNVVCELAGARNRDFAVDLLIHITGIAEFGPASLRDYARKHGCTHEWFRREAEKMRERLDLPIRPSQRPEEVRDVYRLMNRRNVAA